MTTGYGRGSGFLPRPPVGKHKSTAADAANDVKRLDAVFREGFITGLRHAASIVRTASSNEEAVRLIKEAMKEPP